MKSFDDSIIAAQEVFLINMIRSSIFNKYDSFEYF